MPIELGGHSPGREAHHPRCEDERPPGAGEHLAERLDCPSIDLRGRPHLPRVDEVVPERKVDHPIGCVGGAAQDLEVVEGPTLDLGSRGLQGGGRVVRAGEPDDLMAIPDELGHHRRADPTGCSSD